MPITTKRPKIKETVGALYYAFNTMTETGEFDPEAYETTNKSEVVKTITTTDNATTTRVRASGKDYETVNQSTSVENEVAFLFSNLYLGKNALKCSGVQSPRLSRIHLHSFVISSSESFSPSISIVVSSSRQQVSFLTYFIVSSTG